MIKVFIDDLKVVYKGFFVRGLKPLVNRGVVAEERFSYDINGYIC